MNVKIPEMAQWQNQILQDQFGAFKSSNSEIKLQVLSNSEISMWFILLGLMST